jgi:hypothetical protein
MRPRPRAAVTYQPNVASAWATLGRLLVSPASDGLKNRSILIAAWRARRAATGAVVTQSIIIQITTAITPKDPMTARTTKQRSKKSI